MIPSNISAAEKRKMRKQKLQSQRQVQSSPIGTLKTSLFKMNRSVLQARDDTNSALRLYNNLLRDHGMSGVVQLTQLTRNELQQALQTWAPFAEDQTRLKTQSQVSHTLARRMDFVVVNLLKIQIVLRFFGTMVKDNVQDPDVVDFHKFLNLHFGNYWHTNSGQPSGKMQIAFGQLDLNEDAELLSQTLLRNASKWFTVIFAMPRSAKEVIQEQGKTIIGMSVLGSGKELTNIRWLLFVTQIDTYVNFQKPSFRDERTLLKTICTEMKNICPEQSRRVCFKAVCVPQSEIDVEDWECPTYQNMLDLKMVVDKGTTIMLHCTAGWGRTGFMLSSLLFGYFKLVTTLPQCVRYLLYNYRIMSSREIVELLAKPEKEHTQMYFFNLQQVYPNVKALVKLKEYGVSQHEKGKAFISHAEEQKFIVEMPNKLRKYRKSLAESTENVHTYNSISF